ncbi:HAD-IA family hydrolase [Pseudonocardia sp. KRD-184]|uniref:HAD-IA family hydrolase n=1 Tax=Pseudonocardia oceani TaxID=2792013 RepID=A0ABS6UIZ7_9PSEU|nr:HAD-IA family hydrolase [Pseudonocardia oceani]MBW0091081.1 HAD-IA family hydrolase [Pseudonocardia oceani]MBW0098178.1 HAD-IA family hydrolase [Pseudonocardia oceani]MBW0113025.1 HAD-IA family hydrolase [Pseudonocardia oceani]MBW0122381.1 HAD-IA family hydrolase [Pseudonocardia oceani]MBW0132213.1 HAD-IA family hydrolase [Pseudonocardia oceani]
MTQEAQSAARGPDDRPRAADRRPRVVLFDVFETMLQVDALGSRFVDVGRPAHEWELFFTRTLRDGMALTLAGSAPPFGDVARAALRTTTGHTLSDEALDHVLAGFAHLPPHPDVEPALVELAKAKVPTYAFTHGNPKTACDALDRAGLRTYLRGVHSAEAIGAFKPPPRVYDWVCGEVESAPDRTALVAVHSWDVHGAVRAGLVGALATRLEGRVPAVVEPPHVSAPRVDLVVDRLLALPA